MKLRLPKFENRQRDAFLFPNIFSHLFTNLHQMHLFVSLCHWLIQLSVDNFFFPFRVKVHLNWDIMAAKITSIFFSKL